MLMGAYSKDDYLTRDELRALPVPAPQGPWHHPVGFGQFVDLIDDELNLAGYRVANEEHYTQRAFQRHFGVLTVASREGVLGGDGWTLMLGVKGSHDQSTDRGLVMGEHVGVCSNGMFSGDLGSLKTKQTTHIWDRLRDLVRAAVGRLGTAFEERSRAIEDKQRLRVDDALAWHVLVQCFYSGALSSVQLGHALTEWRSPTFSQHLERGRTLWLLEQSITQAMKPQGHAGVSPLLLAERTRKAGRVIDTVLAEGRQPIDRGVL